jgi:ABC-2 type transport system permease protein
VTPLGWAENLRPLVGSRPAWLIPIVASTAVLAALSLLLAGRRDLGTGVLAAQDTAPARTRLLGGPTLLAARLGRSTAAVWLGAVAFSGLFFGDISRSAVSAISGSFQKDLGRIGAHRAGIETMLGLIFLILAVYLAIIAAGQMGAARDEEATGRLDNLLVRPVGRWAWLAGRLGWSTALVVACGVVAGFTMWLGSSIGGGGPGLGTVLAAGINIVPPALLLLGIGVVLLATVPRLAPGLLYGVIGWAFLVEFLGSVVKFSHWLLDTSVFFHMAPAPAADPNWASAAAMVGLGIAAAMLGGLLFRRRDLASA